MSVGRTGFKLLVAKGVSTVILFIGLAYFARELSPALMGSFFLFRVLNDGFGLVADFGIRRAVEKRLSGKGPAAETFTTGLVMKLVLVLVCVGLILLGQDIINGYLGQPLAVPLAASVLLTEISWYFVHILRGEIRVDDTAGIEASRLIVWVVVGVILVELGYGLLGVVYGFIAGLLVLGLWAFIAVETSFGRPSWRCAKSIFSFSRYDFISNTGGYIYNWIDVAIIGFFLTQADVGIYEIAWQVTIPIALIAETTATTLFPQVSQWHANQSKEAISRVMSQAAGAGLFASIPAFAGVLVFSAPILGVLFGPAYAAGATVLIILMAEKVVSSIGSVLNITLRAIDEPREAAWATIGTVVTNLGLNVLLVPLYGIHGAAVATFCSVCLNGALTWYFLNRHIPIRLPVQLASRIVLISGVMALILLPFRFWLSLDSLVELLPVILFGVFIYCASATFVPTLRREIVQPSIRIVTSTN